LKLLFSLILLAKSLAVVFSARADPQELIKLENQNSAGSAKKNKTFAPLINVPVYPLSGDEYWSGWIKYFHMDTAMDILKPTKFYENPYYFSQKVKEAGKEKSDDKGSFMIPTKNHFFAKLLASGSLNILGQRHQITSNTVENLNTDLIDYILQNDNANGAIKDIGSFREGSCMSVSVTMPDPLKNKKFNPRTDSGAPQTWIICTDEEVEKKRLMSWLISMKLKRQTDLDDVLTEKTKTAGDILGQRNFTPTIERYNGTDASQDDGYWILLQDWSECSLKCGGGTETQQWMCVPPKKKGKPCIGKAIREKPCHPEACPSVHGPNELPTPKDDKNHITLKPIYKAMAFSKRPQQYVKCLIKENDILYKTVEYDPEKKTPVKVPGRIVMNTKTISVFTDDNYSHSLFSFNLVDTVFSRSGSDYCCFYLTSANRQQEVCGFNSNCGSIANPIWVAKWGFDFEYFQKKCYQDFKINDPNKLKDLNRNAGAPGRGKRGPSIPLTDAMKEVVEGRKKVIEKKVEENNADEMDKKVDTTQKIALTAIRREINLEDMIKNEEISKGREETAGLYKQMKQEKKKKALLEQALSTREDNYSKVRVAKDTQKKIDAIKADTEVDIKFKRNTLKKKIEDIRKKFKRKNRQLQQQINLIRAETANEIMDANRKGDEETCKNARKTIELMKAYCENSFTTDYNKLLSCKEPENFCYSCCEGEFGNMYIANRDDCQSMCDDEEKKDLKSGDFVWTPPTPSDAPK
jgi:hypothetical protein